MKKKVGFGLLTPEQRTANARKGGLAAHAKGHAYRWTSAEAKAAGKKGGQHVRKRRLS